MLDSILDLVKGPVTEVITKSKDVPTAKKTQAINQTTNAIADTLQSSITPENISQLTSLFSGNKKSLSGNNFLTEGIKSTIVNILGSKFGLSKTAAGGIASAIIPTLMNMLASKVGGGSASSGGIDIGSLIGMFAGGGSTSKSSSKGDIAGNVIGTLGKLFKK